MQTSTSDQKRTAVRQAYGAIATARQSGCCGNPQAIAALNPGEGVLDLGSGAGFDASWR